MSLPVSSRDMPFPIEKLPKKVLAKTLSMIPKPELPELLTVSTKFKKAGLYAFYKAEKAPLQKEILTLRSRVFGENGNNSEDLKQIAKIKASSLENRSDILVYQTQVRESLAEFFIGHPIIAFTESLFPRSLDQLTVQQLSQILKTIVTLQRTDHLEMFTSMLKTLQGDAKLIKALSSFVRDFSSYQDFMDAVVQENVTDRNLIYKKCLQFDSQLSSVIKVFESKNDIYSQLRSPQYTGKLTISNISDVSDYFLQQLSAIEQLSQISTLLLYLSHHPSFPSNTLVGTRTLTNLSNHSDKEAVGLQFLEELLKSDLFLTADRCINRTGVKDTHFALLATALLKKFGMEKAFKYLDRNFTGKALISVYKAFAIELIGNNENDACLEIVDKLLKFSDEPEALSDALREILKESTRNKDLYLKLQEKFTLNGLPHLAVPVSD